MISVENLSKKYVLGERIVVGDTLRDRFSEGAASFFRRALSRKSGDREKQDLWALKEVSFDVHDGEVLGVIGKNGSGKSTLLKIIARITSPTAGEVRLYGRVGSLLEVGTGFHGELSGRDNIFLSGAILGMKKAEIQRKFDEIVDFAGVERFIDTPIKRYSSGMNLRLAFAVAAHLETEIILVDEVLAVGDAEFRKKCFGKMSQVSNEGRTVLLVSHDLNSIVNLCSRAILLQSGQLVFDGPPQKTVGAYLNDQRTYSVSLVDRKDRAGDGLVRFTKIELLNSSGHAIETLQAGQGVRIRASFVVASAEGVDTDGILVAIRIKDSLGQRLGTLSSKFAGFSTVYDKKIHEGVFECDVPYWPFTEDSYILDAWITYRQGSCDFIERVLEFDVIPGSFYPTGNIPVAHFHGPFLFQQTWVIKASDGNNFRE